jgi:hypothetical protein
VARNRVVTQIQAKTSAEIADALRSYRSVRVVGSDSGHAWRRPVCAEADLAIQSGGVIEHDVEDQVVAVTAGATIAEVQDALAKRGQCLPLGQNIANAAEEIAKCPGTVGGRLSLDLPHSFQSSCGSWRDWVLGLTIVRPDGTVAKCGSKAVKNVAGYDVAKLFIGARGTLGVISEAILRTFPIRALPDPDYHDGIAEWGTQGLVQRTLRSDFEAARQTYADRVIAYNLRSSILYVSCEATDQSYRFPEDWQVGWGLSDRNVSIDDPTLRRLMERTKSIMDPGLRLNPGEFW